MEMDPRRNDLREELLRRRYGEGAVCVCCGESDPVVFHHLAGKHNDSALEGPFCLNCHAKAHEALRAAGVDISHDPQRSFPERLEAVIRSLAVLFQLLAERFFEWANRLREFIDALDTHLPAWRELPEASP
jgi:hypothetical protein